MSALRLILKAPPEQRLDLAELRPERLAGLNEAEIARLPLATTRTATCCGDVFTLRKGDPAEIVIEGGSVRFDNVGASMSAGTLRVTGEVGYQAGRGMAGGRLVIDGDAGPAAGSAMRGGTLLIAGSAGERLAGPGPGERTGMTGGIVIVRGDAGPDAAMRLRRGTVVVEGNAGAGAARAMIAGTLAVCGRAAGIPGLMMRRGTLLLGHRPDPWVGFVPAEMASTVFLKLLADFLRLHSPRAAALASGAAVRLAGDLAVDGRGELLLPAG